MVNDSQFNGTTASGPMSWDKFCRWKWHRHKIFEWQNFCFILIIFTCVFFIVSVAWIIPWCSVYRLRRGNFARIIIYVYFILFIPVNIIWHRWSLSFCCCYVWFFSLSVQSFSLLFPLLFAIAKASNKSSMMAVRLLSMSFSSEYLVENTKTQIVATSMQNGSSTGCSPFSLLREK